MKRILSIDGGGMKGFVPCSILADIERRTGKPCNQFFDLIAGTSIGGIVALLLSIGVPAIKALEFFTVDGPEIFRKHWWSSYGILMPRYSARPIESCLKSRFKDSALSDCRCNVMVTAFDLANRSSVFFKSYEKKYGYLLCDIARATSAAQTFFPPFCLNDMVLWDGGNEANNPSLCAYADAIKLWSKDEGGRRKEQIKVLSLGCGASPCHYNTRRLVNGGLLRNGMATVEVLFDAASDVTDYQMKQLIGDDYCRIQPKFATPVELDDASHDALDVLRWTAKEYLVRFSPVLDQFLKFKNEV